MYIKTLTVSDINKYIKKAFDSDFILANCSIKGEISNFKYHSSGHMYFSLKDEYSRIKCIMFKDSVRKLTFLPEDGMRVIVKGRISVYEKEGAYQLYCSEMKPEGMGELYLAFEKLKTKLNAGGLFDEQHKKEIPVYAAKIGIVTSPTGAAVRDIINVTRRRNSKVQLLIYPSLVQGVNASEDIIKGINRLNSIEDVDLIIVARGGGSIEDLWCFNDEKLAEAIYDSEKPIITGIGHEIDYTIADFVSDRRAPTPSAAAEIAVFNMNEFLQRILSYKNMMSNCIDNRINGEKNKLLLMKKRLKSYNPMMYITNQYEAVDKLKQMLNLKINTRIQEKREQLAGVNSLLSAHNPLNVLNRGYSIIEDERSDIIGSIKELDKKDKVKIIMKDGNGKFKLVHI
ncbi:exodeoxyribonuclease VII large subunit [Clostridium luticellarii]|jgi:exodeoxyribonuclease VII large subunit|uniref:Exodeoxyribonuclease 7 large subunit n=1 Tax=Clostridium luticellarii TaxID=1691940 RepID=A0A2T0BRN2_9CLOT|nr:exodeoxyribonuclease VII large subunit [Clostridium luticellarii]MCI1943753.1 exodeoxyribonuclease VII large subunit [Clostridium luticellarii]MCI1967014.1 exodeoxyribonuclease VII large subunit [Clostridium luticellarii]MCI1994381.1 exodeoxyribonuclease VII large subunit [Clostridium luticellarii]MCI2038666.1 exodeoxyribonuclease VII large subunit [Clostridium luticellarii]PRR86541.1 Exodeoxyribonuclease 7 large subunit [Clostridium luticellarii]